MSNQVIFSGRIQEDPELKFTNSGAALASFTLITTTGAKKEGDQFAPNAFLDVTVWNGKNNKLAENVVESLHKGDRAIITGKLVQNEWEAQDGTKRSKLVFTAFEVGVDLTYSTVQVQENERTGRQTQGSSAPDWS
jgi:single-strand DNA-binding protein